MANGLVRQSSCRIRDLKKYFIQRLRRTRLNWAIHFSFGDCRNSKASEHRERDFANFWGKISINSSPMSRRKFALLQRRSSPMAKTTNKGTQDIDALRQRHNALNTKKIQAEQDLKNVTRQLDALKKAAREKH